MLKKNTMEKIAECVERMVTFIIVEMLIISTTFWAVMGLWWEIDLDEFWCGFIAGVLVVIATIYNKKTVESMFDRKKKERRELSLM